MCKAAGSQKGMDLQANLSVLENALSKQDSALEHSQLQDQSQLVDTPFAGAAVHEGFLGQAQRDALVEQVRPQPFPAHALNLWHQLRCHL